MGEIYYTPEEKAQMAHSATIRMVRDQTRRDAVRGIIGLDPDAGKIYIPGLSDSEIRLHRLLRNEDPPFPSENMIAENGAWSPWRNLHIGKAGKIHCGILPNDTVELFSIRNGEVVHSWPENGEHNFVSWHSLDGYGIQGIGIGRNEDNRLEVFARGGDNRLYHKYKRHEWGNWGDWEDMGGNIISAPQVVNLPFTQRMDLFAIGSDRALWHRWQHEPNGGWSDWNSLGGYLSENFTVGTNKDGRLEAFVIGTDGQIYNIWQNDPEGDWSRWGELGINKDGRGFKNIVAGNTSAGQIELFSQTYNGSGGYDLYHAWQYGANGVDGWSEWFKMPNGFLTLGIEALQNEYGNMEVFGVNRNTRVGHRYFDDGQWSKWIEHRGTPFIDVKAVKPRSKIWLVGQTFGDYAIKTRY